MSENVLVLPNGFIGKEDEAKLESFGAYLVKHGAAARWRWERERGIDVAFKISAADGRFLCLIKRDQEHDVFYVTSSADQRIEEGKLEHVMAVVEQLAKLSSGSQPA